MGWVENALPVNIFFVHESRMPELWLRLELWWRVVTNIARTVDPLESNLLRKANEMIRVVARSRLAMLTLLMITTACLSFLAIDRIMSAPIRVAYTVTFQEWLYDRSGKLVLTQTGQHAQRADGSTVRARNIPRPDRTGFVIQRAIFDLVRAEEIAIDPLTESITTTPLRRDNVEFYRKRAAATKCTAEDPVVRNTMLGYEVVRDVQNIGSHTGPIMRKEVWRSPALGCLPLKETLSLGRTEADVSAATIREVLKVEEGEPAAALFELPDGYVERSPSARSEELQKRYPQASCPSCLRQSNQELDEVYSRRQADRGK